MAKTLRTPYADLLPPLATDEFEALRASIKTDGVRDPVITDEDGNVLDGHHRLKIDSKAPRRVVTGLTAAEKQAFVFQANFVRRNLSPSQKAESRRQMQRIAAELRAEDAKKNTQKRVAMLLGVTQQRISDWWKSNGSNTGTGNTSTPAPDARVKIPPKARPKVLERVESGDKPSQVAADFGVSERQIRTIVSQERKTALEVERREKAAADGAGDPSIQCVDFRQLEVASDSIDFIFTDPPYDAESVCLYVDLSRLAARVLRPGGWCLAYAGKSHLPDVMAALASQLEYGWTFICTHSGGDARFRNLKIQTGWKPIIGCYKPPLSAWWPWFKDVASGGREKADHPWQQAMREAAHFIDSMCPKSGTVMDPMCGSGTTLLAAKQSGRPYIGCDIDSVAVETARKRLNDDTLA